MTAGHDTARRAPVWTLLVLTGVYGLNYVDRQILGILIQPIKQEFGLSDTQLGVLTGLAFALFYALMGIPISRLAGRLGYRTTLAAAVGLFSLATTATAFVGGFWQLLVARVVVGVGEAGTTPVSLAIIATLYPERRRAGAMAVFTIGAQVGVLVGFALAGLIAARYGWRAGFLVSGLPGLGLILLVRAVVPRNAAVAADPVRPFGTIAREVLRSGDFWWLALAASGALFMVGAAANWMPAYLARAFGTGVATTSLIFGLGAGIWGPVATLGCGRLADRLFVRAPSAPLLLAAASLMAAAAAFILALLQAEETPAAVLLAIGLGLTGAWQAPVLARLQATVPPADRPTATAMFMLINSSLGLALGPLFVGIVSEALGHGSAAGLRLAIGCAMAMPLVGAGLLVRLARRSMT